ncbi:MAG: hypothetical protein LC775_19205 [Acidobacteria bacterium]|nr:hypothetical protein [Acidobacteriota bacterium]
MNSLNSRITATRATHLARAHPSGILLTLLKLCKFTDRLSDTNRYTGAQAAFAQRLPSATGVLDAYVRHYVMFE